MLVPWIVTHLSGDSWMYPYQRTPMGIPVYICPIFMGSYNPQEFSENTINAMSTLLGVPPMPAFDEAKKWLASNESSANSRAENEETNVLKSVPDKNVSRFFLVSITKNIFLSTSDLINRDEIVESITKSINP